VSKSPTISDLDHSRLICLSGATCTPGARRPLTSGTLARSAIERDRCQVQSGSTSFAARSWWVRVGTDTAMSINTDRHCRHTAVRRNGQVVTIMHWTVPEMSGHQLGPRQPAGFRPSVLRLRIEQTFDDFIP
jgi:hypothetical protein